MSTPDRGFSTLADQAVDVRRYVDALRNGAWLIALIVVVVTGVAVAVSKALPKTYSASARLVYNPASSVLGTSSAESTIRQLATYESLVKEPVVISAAAKRLGESPDSLKSAVSASADASANILTISATGDKPSLASSRADAVAQAFVTEERAIQNRGYQSARTQLEDEINELKRSPNGAAQIAALESRISALQISATGTESELQIAEAATAPSSATSPRPTLNGIIALIVSLLLGVFIVLGRDQLRPRFSSPRELGGALGLPVLAGLPYRRRFGTPTRRRALRGLEREAYDLLRTAVLLMDTPSEGPRVVLVSSATHAEGKSTVTANLGRSVARSGKRTLVVSGDIRSPTLHEHFKVANSSGLSDVLQSGSNGTSQAAAIADAIRSAPGEPGLDVLVAGDITGDPSAFAPALGRVVQALRSMSYDYVLIDSPPMLGIADAQLLAGEADDVLLVARLDRISPYQAEELAGLLERLHIAPMGLVVFGARVELSPYYVSERALATNA